MSHFVGKPMDLESQRVIQMLKDKIIFIYQSKNYTDEIDILEKACHDIDIKLLTYYREDLSNIFYYSCQLILNENICFVCGTGDSQRNSYKNAAEKFLNHCFEINQTPPISTESQSSFIDNLNESYNNINSVEKFIEIIKYYAGKNNKLDYEIFKNWLKCNRSDFSLSESFTVGENCYICSIYLNENLLLQQGRGETNGKSLANTFKEFTEAYSIVSNQNVESNTVIAIQDKKLIIRKMAEKFNENVSGFTNRWTILEKSAQELGYNMVVHNTNKTCSVNINNVEIIKVDCDNDYCGYIAACKDLIQLLEKNPKYKSPPKDKMKFPLQKISTCHGKEEKIKSIIRNANIIRENNPTSPVWTIVNNAFQDVDMKLELHYAHSKSNATICSFDCQGLQIVFAEGDTKPSSREAAALKLLDDPAYSN